MSEEKAAAPSKPQMVKNLYRVRLTHTRREALRYTSHLDMQMVWERTLRRARVPLAYSQGFSPRPRLHLASALPLGFLSCCEMADFWLELPEGSPAPNLDRIIDEVRLAAPPGLEILSGTLVPLGQPALQTQVQSAEYLACPLDPLDPGGLAGAVAELLAAATLPRERRKKPGAPGKAYDLRPLVEALQVLESDPPDRPRLFMRLAAREGATGRPEELLAALGQEPAAWRIERTKLVL